MISFFTSFNVKGTEEQLYMGVQLFKAFGFSFRLAVADTEQGDDRGNVHPCQCIRVLIPNFTACDQGTENSCMVRDHTVHIAFREQCCKLRGAELLQRHHPAELTDLLIVQRIQKDLPNFVRKSLLRDMRKRRAVLLYILHMNVDPARIFFVVGSR